MIQYPQLHSKIELVSLKMLIINIEDNGIAARISNGADVSVITKENNDLMLVTDKFDPMVIPDKMNLCWLQIQMYLEQRMY